MVVRNFGGIMIGKQSAKGTAATPTVGIAYNGSPSFNAVDSKIVRSNSRMRSGYQAVPDRAGVTGDFAFDATPREIGYLCDLFFGTTTTTQLTGSAYKHEFKAIEQTENMKWGTFEYVTTGQSSSRKAIDTRVNSLEISYGNQGFVGVSAGWGGIKPKIENTPTTLAFNDETPFVFHQDASQLDDVTDPKIVSATVSFGNNLDMEDFVAGSRFREDMVAGELSVGANVTFKYQDDTWIKRYFGSDSALEPLAQGDVYHATNDFNFKMVGSAIPGGGASDKFQVEHLIPDPIITNYSEGYDVGQYKYITLTLAGVYDLNGAAGEKEAGRMILQNDVSSYTTW